MFINNEQVKGAETQASTTSDTSPTPSSNQRLVYLGAWTQGFFDAQTDTLHPEVLKSFETKVAKKVAIAHYYRGWEALDSQKFLDEVNEINAKGWRPMVSTNPYFFSKCPTNSLPLYKAIAAGNCDEFLKNIGINLKKLTKPLFLRFAWEMNISSMEWQIERTGSTNVDFISAWQRFHHIIYQEGATNVLWVFAPDVGRTSYQNFYPGSAYVDWLGLDGYNWGLTQPWSKWQSFSEVFTQAYQEITKLAPNKPLMISEVNTTDQGGSKPEWYHNMLEDYVPNKFPNVKAIVIYNEDRRATESVNWLIDVSGESLKAFSQGIKNPIYISSF